MGTGSGKRQHEQVNLQAALHRHLAVFLELTRPNNV